MIDTKTGQRKLTEKGPTMGPGIVAHLNPPPLLRHNALKRVETTLPFEVIEGSYSPPESEGEHNMFEAYK